MGNPFAQHRPPSPHCVYTNMSGAWRCHQCGRPPPREIVRFLGTHMPIPENIRPTGRCPAVCSSCSSLLTNRITCAACWRSWCPDCARDAHWASECPDTDLDLTIYDVRTEDSRD